MGIKQRIHNNSLMLIMFGIFVLTIVGMSFAGWAANNQELSDHGRPFESYGSYLVSGEFIEGVFENWESEFLQMWALTVLTIYLRQKGSKDSKPIRGKTPQDARSHIYLRNATTMGQRFRAVRHWVYSRSLGLALLALFIISISLHAIGGTAAYNEENAQHGQPTVSVGQYVMSSQFWYESLQNWQSEFLAIGTLLLLSIKLRERGSPQSKPVGVRFDRETG